MTRACRAGSTAVPTSASTSRPSRPKRPPSARPKRWVSIRLLCRAGARCSSVVRAFAHGAMGRQIDPSWSGPRERDVAPWYLDVFCVGQE